MLETIAGKDLKGLVLLLESFKSRFTALKGYIRLHAGDMYKIVRNAVLEYAFNDYSGGDGLGKIAASL